MKLCILETMSSPRTHKPEDVSSPHPTSGPLWSAALLAQQLPPMQHFTGEDAAESGETFQDWIEQLEMIASIGHWDERTKLMNLTTLLRGQAYAFYESCPEQQRKSYSALKDELPKRFTQCDCMLYRVVCSMTGSSDALGRRWMLMHRTCVVCSIWPILKPNKKLKRQRTWDKVCSHTSLWQDCDRTLRSSWLEWREHLSSCWRKLDWKKPSWMIFLRECLDHYHHHVGQPLC